MASAISAVISVISFVYQYTQQKKAEAAAKKAAQAAAAAADAAKGTKITIDAEVAPLRLLYGRNAVGGVRVFTKTFSNFTYVTPNSDVYYQAGNMQQSVAGKANEMLMSEYALCVGEITACYAVDVNEQSIVGEKVNAYGEVKYDGTGTLKNEFSKGACVWIHYQGGSNCAIAHANGREATAVFTGVPHATGVFRYDRDDPQYAGPPELVFFVEGKKVRPILFDGSNYTLGTPVYSNNPALCILDYLMEPTYGRGLTESDLDLASFYEVARVVGRIEQQAEPLGKLLFAKHGSNLANLRDVPRYECNIGLDTSRTIRENLNSMLDTLPTASLVWCAGKYSLRFLLPLMIEQGKSIFMGDVYEAYNPTDQSVNLRKAIINTIAPALVTQTDVWNYLNDPAKFSEYPVIDVTDDDIIRGKEVAIVWPNSQTRLNNCTVRFLDEAREFEENTVTWPPKTSLIYSTFLSEDSQEALETDIFVNGITSYYNALAKAEEEVRRSRLEVTYELTVSRKLIDKEVGDVIRISSTVLGIPGEIAIITEFEPDPEGFIKISAKKLVAAAFAWSVKDDQIIPTRNLYINDLPQVQNLQYTVVTDGNIYSSGKVFWDPPDDIRVDRYKVVYTTDTIIDENTNWISLGVTSLEYFILPHINEISITVAVISMSLYYSAKAPWPSVTVSNSALALTPISGIYYTQATDMSSSSGTLYWDIPVDLRVTKVKLRYCTGLVADITVATDWTELGEVSVTAYPQFILPVLFTDDYVFTAIAASPYGEAPNGPYVQLSSSNLPYMPLDKKALVVYKRTASAPGTFSKPNAIDPQTLLPSGYWGSYNFDTNVLTPSDSEWFISKPENNMPLYQSIAVAQRKNSTSIDDQIVWSEPETVNETPPWTVEASNTTMLMTTDGVVGTGGNIFGADSAGVGQIFVTYQNVDISTGAQVDYSIIAATHCVPTIDNIVGPTKGTYTIGATSNITSALGSFTIRVIFQGVTVDKIISFQIISMSETVKDPTPPPTVDIANIQVASSLNNIFIKLLTIPDYTAGHGHDKTVVYYKIKPSGGPDPLFSDSDVKSIEFTGFRSVVPSDFGAETYMWFKNRTADGYYSDNPSTLVIHTTGLIGPDTPFFDTAAIGELNVGWLRVDGANIVDASINSGHISDYLESTDWVPSDPQDPDSTSETGWKIWKNGRMDINNLTARGNITANSLNAATGTFTGSLQGVDGTFTGVLQGVTGRFLGTLTAGALDVSAISGQTVHCTVVGSTIVQVPVDATQMRVTLIGGGGGGQAGWGGYAGLGGAGAGGDAGQQVVAEYAVQGGDQYEVILGAGGLPGDLVGFVGIEGVTGGVTPNGPAGSQGGTSYLKHNAATLMTAVGGLGGAKWLGQGNFNNNIGYNPVSGNAFINEGFKGESTEFALGGLPDADGVKGSGGGGGLANTELNTQDTGGTGGVGYCMIEFMNPNALITRGEFDALIDYIGLQETLPTAQTGAVFSGEIVTGTAQNKYIFVNYTGVYSNFKGSNRRRMPVNIEILSVLAWLPSYTLTDASFMIRKNTNEVLCMVKILAGQVEGSTFYERQLVVTEIGNPQYSLVSSQSHCNGAAGQISIEDPKGNAWTRTGNGSISPTKARFGSTSYYFDGSTSLYTATEISNNFSLGNSDFCIEGWINVETLPVYGSDTDTGILSRWGTNATSCASYKLVIDKWTNRLAFYYTVNGSYNGWQDLTSTTLCLLHGNGPDASSYIKDEAENYVYSYGAVNAEAQTKFGLSSIWCDSFNALHIPDSTIRLFNTTFLTQNFTVEGFIYLSSVPAGGIIAKKHLQWGVIVNADRTVTLELVNNAVIYTTGTSTATVPLNQWVHLAFIRYGNVFRVFLDGVIIVEITAIISLYSTTADVVVGGEAVAFFIDEFRISSVTRYTDTSFTPPSAPFVISDGAPHKVVYAGEEVPYQTWMHFAVVRNGSSLTLYQNGIAGLTHNIGTSSIYDWGSNGIRWGKAWDLGNANAYGHFYLDEFRITKGAPMYTANFPVQVLPFADSSEDVTTYTDLPVTGTPTYIVAVGDELSIEIESSGIVDPNLRITYRET